LQTQFYVLMWIAYAEVHQTENIKYYANHQLIL